MRVSTRGRYAVRAIIYLAEKYGEGPVPLAEISKNQAISVKYLENIMRTLINSGIVSSTSGKKGGYILAKEPGQVKVLDILRITEGSLSPVACVDNPAVCSRVDGCKARNMWKGLGKAIDDYLESADIGRISGIKKTGARAG